MYEVDFLLAITKTRPNVSVFSLFCEPILTAAWMKKFMEAETVLVVPPPSPRPFPLCGICVSSPEAATLKVVTLGDAIPLSLECFLPPQLSHSRFQKCKLIFRPRLNVNSLCSSKASIYSNFYHPRVV